MSALNFHLLWPLKKVRKLRILGFKIYVRYAGVYPEFIPGNYKLVLQQGSVCLPVVLPGIGIGCFTSAIIYLPIRHTILAFISIK